MKYSLSILAIVFFSHSQSFADNLAHNKNKKTMGIEINIPRLLTLTGNHNWQSASGSFSYFDHKNNAEIAVPWLLEKLEANAKEQDRTLSDQTIALHYRKFLGENLNGVYWSGFVKLAHVTGRERDYGYQRYDKARNKSPCRGEACESNLGDDSPGYYSNPKKSSYKFGLGIGTGYRFFPKNKPYYWGASISVGQYITGKHNLYDGGTGVLTADSKYIVDIELLKFGYAF